MQKINQYREHLLRELGKVHYRIQNDHPATNQMQDQAVKKFILQELDYISELTGKPAKEGGRL